MSVRSKGQLLNQSLRLPPNALDCQWNGAEELGQLSSTRCLFIEDHEQLWKMTDEFLVAEGGIEPPTYGL
jgi:hypothetical protein